MVPSPPRTSTSTGALESIVSRSWKGDAPAISVVIPTHERSAFLTELVAALEQQTLTPERFEIAIVDDASSDDTWETLGRVVAATPLRMTASRLTPNHGPAEARNVAAAISRGPILAFTDDDCIPAPGWLESLLESFASGADVVQGRTLPAGGAGPWDRTVHITEPTPLFESCNIAYRRSTFTTLGGFPSARPGVVRGTRPHFGEDAELGWRARARGDRTAFAPDAVVHHRIYKGRYRDWLREQRRMSLFPALVRRTPGMAEALWGGIFLTRQTAVFDLAVAAGVFAILARRPLVMIGLAPWLAGRMRAARRRGGFSRFVKLAVGDAIGLASLLEGSVRSRRLVL